MSIKLYKCPGCGGDVRMIPARSHHPDHKDKILGYSVSCPNHNCPVLIHTKQAKTKQEAADCWNGMECFKAKVQRGKGTEAQSELIKALAEIGAEHKDDFVAFPMLIKKEDVDMTGYEKQRSDLSSFEFEYINQKGSHYEDSFSGFILYPFKDMFIKVYFEC